MTQKDDWSPDEPLGTEAFEQGDDAFDDKDQLDPDFLEAVELDPSIDPSLQLDDRELGEAGVELDDPEALVSLDGGMDDPDGLGQPSPHKEVHGEDVGWDLDAPQVTGSDEASSESD